MSINFLASIFWFSLSRKSSVSVSGWDWIPDVEGSGATLSSWFTLEYLRGALFDFLPPFGDLDLLGEGFLPFLSLRLRISSSRPV